MYTVGPILNLNLLGLNFRKVVAFLVLIIDFSFVAIDDIRQRGCK